MNKLTGTILAAAAGLMITVDPQTASAEIRTNASLNTQSSHQGLLHKVRNFSQRGVRQRGIRGRQATGERYRGDRSRSYQGYRDGRGGDYRYREHKRYDGYHYRHFGGA